MVKKIAVTGAAGQIAYSLLFRIASGELLGSHDPMEFHLLETENSIKHLEGVVMELEDCAFPLIKRIVFGTNPNDVFKDVDYAFLIGATPRGPGMERNDLLQQNGKIFVEQGKALSNNASKNVLSLVVGNPCNTNCLIAMKNAKNLLPRHFYSMTYLDQHRAMSMLAKEAGVEVDDLADVIVWGNHSSTMVPDFLNAKIRKHPVEQVIKDRKWLEEKFVPAVQKRGAEVIAARGKSSAASAAHAALWSMRRIIYPSREIFSMGVLSDGNPYGITPGIVFSFPCKSLGDGNIEIVPGFKMDPFLKGKIALSEKELCEERESIKGIL